MATALVRLPTISNEELRGLSSVVLWTAKSTQFATGRQELVIFVGLPASGKSTFAERFFVPQGYVRVNQVR